MGSLGAVKMLQQTLDDFNESTLFEDKSWYVSAITKSIGKAHKINVLNF